jgi:hypothetical protein
MLDVDTFLTALYVMVDDLCQFHQTECARLGPDASLLGSEVITLATFARWRRFASERDFYRYASEHLREAFPTLPDRSQFNRLVRFPYLRHRESGREAWNGPTSFGVCGLG